MKKFNTLLLAALFTCSYQFSSAQSGALCEGNKGPNLLGPLGTFSSNTQGTAITVNTNADACLRNGANTYSPNDNIGNKLNGCSASSGNTFPCSDYTYTDKSNGMQPEFTYSIMKVMGDANGSNCIHSPIWEAKDHTGDNGYFMAVNGAPSAGYSTTFYQIKSIPVCVGSTYEFSAWVINMMPSGTTSAAPNVSFTVNGVVIGNSGAIPYDHQWHKVGGQFVATTPTVDLQVINATLVAGGNDLGLDDISINVCQSQIVVSGPDIVTEGTEVSPEFTVSGVANATAWYRWELSSDGGLTYDVIDNGQETTYDATGKFVVSYDAGIAFPEMNGWKYRLVVASSQQALNNPDCIYINDYFLKVASGGPLPVRLSSFSGNYNEGTANLSWQTSQELNNDRFELFRSFDGQDFSLVATIAGSGNSYVAKNYAYSDKVTDAKGNNVFYKLKQIDKDGKFAFSNVIRLSLGDAKTSFRIFPNPVATNFTASFTAPRTGKATMLIRNTKGQTVYMKTVDVLKGNNSIQVNTPQLIAGMYYISIANEEINYNAKIQKL